MGTIFRIRSAIVFAALIMLALPPVDPASAQELPQIRPAPPADPARVPRMTRQLPSPPPPEEPALAIERPPRPEPEITPFNLCEVVLEGATVISPAELRPLWAAQIGRPTTRAELEAIAQAITARYAADDYFISRAILAPDPVTGCTARILVVEGYVEEIDFRGRIEPNERLLRAMAEKIRADRPLRRRVMNRYLYLMDDLPGVTTSADIELRPGDPAAQLEIVVDYDPFRADATLDNRGTQAIGPDRASLTVRLNSPLGLSERFTGRVVTTPLDTDELLYGEGQYFQVLNSEGTRILGSYARYRAKPDVFILPGMELVGRGELGSASLVHPFIRSADENLYGILLYSHNNIDARLENAFHQLIYDDRIRSLQAGFLYEYPGVAGAEGVLAGRVTKGLDIFNASNPAFEPVSRPEADFEFVRLNGEATYLQPFPGAPAWAIFLAAAGQYSPDPLPASEEFGIGGAEFVRAFDPSEFTGDRGLAAKVELRYRGAVDLAIPNFPNLEYTFYGFYDHGAVWNVDDLPQPERVSAASAGGGLRLEIEERFNGFVEVAVPLVRTPTATDDRSPRVFFGGVVTF